MNSVGITIAANADNIRLLHLVIKSRICHDRRSSLVVRIASQRYVHNAVATGIKRSVIIAVDSTIDSNSVFTLKISLQLRRSRTDSTALSISSCHISKAKHIRCNQINIVSVLAQAVTLRCQSRAFANRNSIVDAYSILRKRQTACNQTGRLQRNLLINIRLRLAIITSAIAGNSIHFNLTTLAGNAAVIQLNVRIQREAVLRIHRITYSRAIAAAKHFIAIGNIILRLYSNVLISRNLRIIKRYTCFINHIAERPYAAQTSDSSLNRISIQRNLIVMQRINVHALRIPAASCNSVCYGINLALSNRRCRADIHQSAAIAIAFCVLLNYAIGCDIHSVNFAASISASLNLYSFCRINLRQIGAAGIHTGNCTSSIGVLLNTAVATDIDSARFVLIITNSSLNIRTAGRSRPVHHKAAKACAYSRNLGVIDNIRLCTKLYSVSLKGIACADCQTAAGIAFHLHASCTNGSTKRSINRNAANLINRVINRMNINHTTILSGSEGLSIANGNISCAAIFNHSIEA